MGFQLSQPDCETPFESLCERPPAAPAGSRTSLDELTSSQRKEESADSKSNVNNNKDTANEDNVDIEICPLEQAVDTEEEGDDDDDELEIDIYPLDHELSAGHIPGDGQNAQPGQHSKEYSREQLFSHVFLGDASVTVPNLAKIVRIYINSSSGESSWQIGHTMMTSKFVGMLRGTQQGHIYYNCMLMANIGPHPHSCS